MDFIKILKKVNREYDINFNKMDTMFLKFLKEQGYFTFHQKDRWGNRTKNQFLKTLNMRTIPEYSQLLDKEKSLLELANKLLQAQRLYEKHHMYAYFKRLVKKIDFLLKNTCPSIQFEYTWYINQPPDEELASETYLPTM